jgi:hypothetical protein
VEDGGTGDSCASDADCAAEYHCTAGKCAADAGPGGACTNDAGCLDGYHCSETTGKCAADLPLGSPCTVTDDCVEGLECLSGTCSDKLADGSPCTLDVQCGPDSHCDTVCTTDLPDGAACDEPSDCGAGNCGGGICCALGETCCLVKEDCPAPAQPPACDTPATCQGHGYAAQCAAAFVCQTVETEDDSACSAATVALTCDPYQPVKCTGAAVQTPPACPTSCAVAGDCVANSVCSPAKVCEPILCSLQGNQGVVVDCPLHLVRGALANPSAVQFQLTLDFDATAASVSSLEVCGELEEPFNLPCTVAGNECDLLGDPLVYCDPATLTCSKCTSYLPDDKNAKLVAGHAVVTCAQPPANCQAGKFSLLFWGAESAPINDAYLANDVVVGSSGFVTVKYTLLKNLPAASPVSVSPVDFVATDSKAKSLPLSVVHGTAPNPDHFVVTGTP